jgi:hypothetical protein
MVYHHLLEVLSQCPARGHTEYAGAFRGTREELDLYLEYIITASFINQDTTDRSTTDVGGLGTESSAPIQLKMSSDFSKFHGR